MARSIALASPPRLTFDLDVLRSLIVGTCAMALILAGHSLPF
jgi:hypothetical protein